MDAMFANAGGAGAQASGGGTMSQAEMDALFANAGGAAGMSGRDRALMILCAFLAFAIGLSRINVGVHHPTDVLGGWFAGIATALLILAAVVHMVNTGVTAKLIAGKARAQSESAAQTEAAPAETEDAE